MNRKRFSLCQPLLLLGAGLLAATHFFKPMAGLSDFFQGAAVGVVLGAMILLLIVQQHSSRRS